ncbi:MAG: hypothetical protein LW808_001615 [Verrucomicrobiota bacterium]|nr:MAG: hypothetical protein LW808_001615 [Verrucomicrobiota bacterium]
MKNRVLKEITLSVLTIMASFPIVEASGVNSEGQIPLVKVRDRNSSRARMSEKNRQSASIRKNHSSKRVLDIQWCIQQLEEPQRKTMQETLEKIYFVLLLAPEVDSESAMKIFDALPQAYKCIPYNRRWEASTIVLKIGRIITAKIQNPEDQQSAEEKSDALLWTVLSSPMYGDGKNSRKNTPGSCNEKKLCI